MSTGTKSNRTHTFTKVVYSDANEHGYREYVAEKLGNVIARGSFTEMEVVTSSAYHELLTVKHVLLSLSHRLAHKSVLWYSDNLGMSRILDVGSQRNLILDLALEIFAIRKKFDIKLSWEMLMLFPNFVTPMRRE